MSVLPDIASTYIAGVEFVQVVFSMTDFSGELTETLKIILSYKSYFAFFMTYNIYITCMNISLYILVCKNYTLEILLRYLIEMNIFTEIPCM